MRTVGYKAPSKLSRLINNAKRLFKKKEESNLLKHAKREIEAAKIGQTLYGEMLPESLLELLTTFSRQGHSGMSAGITIDLFSKLANFEPLCPLTGADEEWNEIADGHFQNRRSSRVFKDKDRFDGKAYDIRGRVFREQDGSCFTSYESHVPVDFPYTPRTVYVDRPAAK